MNVTTPVLREHQRVAHLVDTIEELPLVIGQRRLLVVLFGSRLRVAHLGHVVLPGQPFGESLRIQGNRQLSHVLSPLVGGFTSPSRRSRVTRLRAPGGPASRACDATNRRESYHRDGRPETG